MKISFFSLWDVPQRHTLKTFIRPYLAFRVPLITDFLLLGRPTSCWLPHHMNGTKNNRSFFLFCYSSQWHKTPNIRGAISIDFTAWRDAKKHRLQDTYAFTVQDAFWCRPAMSKKRRSVLWCSQQTNPEGPGSYWRQASAQTPTSTMTNDFLIPLFLYSCKTESLSPQHVWEHFGCVVLTLNGWQGSATPSK